MKKIKNLQSSNILPCIIDIHYNGCIFWPWWSWSHDWFSPLVALHTWWKRSIHCLPWTLSSEEHFCLLFLVKHLEELLPQGNSQHWKCVPLWQEFYKTKDLYQKRRWVFFAFHQNAKWGLMFHKIMTFAGDWAVCGVFRFVELRAQVGPSNVWPQKWHHTISACGKVVKALVLQYGWLTVLDSDVPDFLFFLIVITKLLMSTKYCWYTSESH